MAKAKTIDDYKLDWEAAKQAGDKTAMDAAHAGAEAIRAQSGYSGGADGSQNIPLKATPDGFTGSSNAVKTHTVDQAGIKDQMNANSIAWHTADEATRKTLEQANKDLAAQLGGSLSFDPATGYWSGDAGKPKELNLPEFDSKYSTQIDQLLNSILNREEFSYDHTTDPSYLAYEQQYKRLGDRAREDTLGDVAGLTGGYASSWAVSAASQAQNDYNSQLSGIIPQLYDAAYNRYLNEDSLDRNDLGLVMGLDQTYYDRYRDTVSDSKWQQEFDTGKSQWEQTFDWNKNVDQWNMSNTEATQKFDQLMSKWQMTGVADSEVAAGLGVPVGATTESYYFNSASLALDQAKLAQSQKESNKVATETNQLEASIARNAKERINGTESYQAGAEYILSAVTSADEYYRVGSQAGIPTSVLQEVFDSFYNQALNDPGKEPTAERDYTYYAALMGQQDDPEAWLIANKYSIPSDILEDLSKLLDY
jgi:hypothetical protein